MFRAILCILYFVTCGSVFSANIGLFITATGKYIEFVKPLVESARNHFCTSHQVTYFVFTDHPPQNNEPDVVYLHQCKRGWPLDTLMRYHTYMKYISHFSQMDYLFACDADMLFVDTVGDEILGERVATLHPGFLNQRGSYESNKESCAYVSPNQGEYYFAGGFYGGTRQEMEKMLKILVGKVYLDLTKGLIATWHDESHWNRYCIDHQPTLILSPSYCYPETVYSFFPKELGNYSGKLLALDKNHEEIRREIP